MPDLGSPRVSVLLAAYNAEATLADALDSIRAQDFTDWELIAVDDGSRDGTRAILEAFARGEPRCHLVLRDRNSGLASCLNAGIGLARGEYIARMDADDRAVPGRLQLQVAFLDAHPEIAILGGGAHVVSEEGAVLGVLERRETHEELCAVIFKENPFIHPTVMARRAVLQALGGYDVTMRRGQDYDLWLRAYRQYRLHNLLVPLVWYQRRRRPTWRDARFSARALTAALRREGALLRAPWLVGRPLLATLWELRPWRPGTDAAG